MGGYAGRPVDSLSGGELQLARLARCLAQEADYLLLDEPGSMLDPANAKMVADALRDIAASGRGVLFSTHDAAFAAHAADTAILVREGSPLASGPARAVLVPELLEAAFGLPFLPQTFPSVYDPA
jgi:iron complex transport system ATP-binding protein